MLPNQTLLHIRTCARQLKSDPKGALLGGERPNASLRKPDQERRRRKLPQLKRYAAAGAGGEVAVAALAALRRAATRCKP